MTTSRQADNVPGNEPGDGAVSPACPECGYNLSGLISQRCPECGWRIDARLLDVLTRAKPLASRRRFRALVATASLGLGALIVVSTLHLSTQSRFSWRDINDVMAGGAAGSAALGLLALAALALRAHRGTDSDRAMTRARFQAWSAASMLLGFAAAAGVWWHPPPAATVRAPESGLEFVLRAMLFGLPGAMLLLLSAMLFESRRGRVARAEALVAAEESDGPGAPFVVQACGVYAEDQVTQEWHDLPRRNPPEVEDLIARTWEQRCADAEARGVLLYNGELARLLRCTATAKSLRLDLGPGCYRDFVGTNLHHAAEVVAHGDDCLGNPCGVSSNVVTRDGYLVLGRRNDRVAYHPGFLHPFGGALEAEDQAAHRFDIFSAARRELCEELGVTPSEIRELACIGLVRDREILQPEFLFDAVLTVSLTELHERFHPEAERQEHSALEWCLDLPEEMLPFIQRRAPVAPIAAGGVLLHGRRQWGMEWYETACLLLYGELPPEKPTV